MSKSMKALVMYAPYDFRYEDVPVPEIGPDEILVKIEACGICAGDIKTYHENQRVWGTSEADRYIEAPVVGGHEFVGRVCALGENVQDYELGQRLIAEQIAPCGECMFCKSGDYHMCQRHYIYGFKKDAQGGMAEYMRYRSDSRFHVIPEGMSVEQAALLEPIACGMHCADRGRVTEQDFVVVSGLGTIGQAIVSVVKNIYHAKTVVALDLRPKRLEMAAARGADYVFNPTECDVVAKIKELTGGYGCDVYIEAAGSEGSVKQGFDAIRNRGRFVEMGVFPRPITADFNVIGDGKEIDIYGSHLSPECYPRVIEAILNGDIPTEGLVTHSFKLEDWQAAFEVAEKDPDAFKVILVP